METALENAARDPKNLEVLVRFCTHSGILPETWFESYPYKSASRHCDALSWAELAARAVFLVPAGCNASCSLVHVPSCKALVSQWSSLCSPSVKDPSSYHLK